MEPEWSACPGIVLHFLGDFPLLSNCLSSLQVRCHSREHLQYVANILMQANFIKMIFLPVGTLASLSWASSQGWRRPRPPPPPPCQSSPTASSAFPPTPCQVVPPSHSHSPTSSQPHSCPPPSSENDFHLDVPESGWSRVSHETYSPGKRFNFKINFF